MQTRRHCLQRLFTADVLLVVVYALMRIVPSVGAETLRYGDTADYVTSSHFGLVSRGLLAGSRAPGYPIILKLVRGNDAVMVGLHLATAIVAWL